MQLCDRKIFDIWDTLNFISNINPLKLYAYRNGTMHFHFFNEKPEDHRKPCNEVGSLSLDKRTVEFEPATFRL